MFKGYKTYLVAALIVGTAVIGWLNGDATVQEAVNQVLAGLGLGALRNGLPK